MSWESRGEDGDGGEQTPGHGQPLFELPLQDPQLQMTFPIEGKGGKSKGAIILLLLVDVAKELSHIHVCVRKERQQIERRVRGKICCLLT